MKNQIHRSLTILMAVLILLSSVGFRFIEHQCMMRGKVAMVMAEKSNDSCAKKTESSCCAAKKKKDSNSTFFKKTECCKDTQKFEKLDVAPSAINKLLGKSLDITSDGLLWFTYSCAFLQSHWSSTLPKSLLKPHTFSSLFHGRSMHFFIQSFLI